jgi:hypothetical protein
MYEDNDRPHSSRAKKEISIWLIALDRAWENGVGSI